MCSRNSWRWWYASSAAFLAAAGSVGCWARAAVLRSRPAAKAAARRRLIRWEIDIIAAVASAKKSQGVMLNAVKHLAGCSNPIDWIYFSSTLVKAMPFRARL